MRQANIVSNNLQYQQVRSASNPQTISPYLQEVLTLTSGSQFTGKPTDCHILDMKYEPESSCSVLYQLAEHMMVGTFRWDETDHQAVQTGQEDLLSGLRVYPFQQDPALPSLPIALDPQAMIPVFNGTLPDCQQDKVEALRCRVTLIRYRLGKRCTLRYDIWFRETKTGAFISRTLFGKVYHDLGKACSVYEEMGLLSNAEDLQNRQITLAKAVAILPDLKIILQAPVQGTELDLLLGRTGDNLALDKLPGFRGIQQAANALAALHQTRVTSKRERPVTKELAKMKRRTAKAATVDAALGAAMGELAEALPAWLEHLSDWGAEIGLVHGDCKPSQFLVNGTEIALLDFDHCGMADQATDVGSFMAKLRQGGVQQVTKARNSTAANNRAHQLRIYEQLFLDQYCSAGGHGPEFRWRATWYEAVALLRKAIRNFARSPRSLIPAALINEAWQCLESLPPEPGFATKPGQMNSVLFHRPTINNGAGHHQNAALNINQTK